MNCHPCARNTPSGPKPLRERTAGAGLEVLLEGNSIAFGCELHRNHQRPGALGLGVAAGPVVVPFETRPKVVGDSDVVTRGIAVASKHVDDSLFDVVHAGHHARNGPVRNQTNRRVSRKDGNAGCRRRSASAGCNDALLRRDSLRMLVSSPALGRSDLACLASGWIRTSNPPVNSCGDWKIAVYHQMLLIDFHSEN